MTTLLVAVAFVVALVAHRPLSDGPRYTLIVVLALGMGAQNATVRRLAVPDATTTVLTMTLTGLAADSPLAAGKPVNTGRRVASVLTMFAGALAGGLLLHHLDVRHAIGLALLLLLAAAVTMWSRAGRTEAVEWAAPASR